MKNKGFTLIELLGSITLLAIIALLAFPAILNLLNGSQNEIDKAKIDYIESAAAEYVNDHTTNYKKIKDNVYTVSVPTLVEQGYISDTMLDSEGDISSWCVVVKVVENTSNNIKDIKYTYEFNANC